MSTYIPNSDPITDVPVVANADASTEQFVSHENTSNLFRRCLMDNLRDGVVFVNAQCRIEVWNQTIEVMTGLTLSKVSGVALTPHLLGLTDAGGIPIPEDQNPLLECFRTKKNKTSDFKIIGRSGREIKVEMTFSPVVGSNGDIHGAVVLVHDSSAQLDLQRQLRDLYEYSMLDPLTQVANRAEFERVLDEFVRLRNTSEFECSLIVCDIDFFKQINDNYNHHIGDQALISFAGLLKKFVRAQDIVARYGGEEFVILCAKCNVESAVQRAEEIRATLTKTPQQMLDGKCITASFGVCELQKGDSATDFFVRADTALLRAKELGRNRVVEANVSELGGDPEMKSAEKTSLAGVQWRKIKGQTLISEEFETTTPLTVLVEKLRGYIVESEAEIRRVEPDFASVIVDVENAVDYSKKGKFLVDIEFQEREGQDDDTIGRRTKTFIRITIREAKRKWFQTNSNELSETVMTEMRRYLMLNDDSAKLKVAPAATKPGKR